MAYIGLDVGTAGCKATVVDAEGRIIAYKYKEYDLIFPRPGWVEIDALTVWEAVRQVLGDLSRCCSCKLKAISIASFGEALVLLDSNDCVLDRSIFYSDIRGTDEIKDILKKIDKTELERLTGMPLNSMLDRECPAEPSHLFLLPHFAGSGTPFMDPYSCGCLLGLKLGTSKGDIYKAILEGICFEIMFNAEMLSACGIEVKEITAVGGGAKSGVLLQIKSDIMGKAVKTLNTSESGTLGLAMLCAVACGDYPDIGTAARAMVKIDKIFYPRKDFNEKYAEKYEVYKRIYPAMKMIFGAGNK